MSARGFLVAALLALAGVYVGWYVGRAHAPIAWALFALPALVLAFAAWRGAARAGFWAALFALVWFAHAVMEAWATPADRGWALAAVALSLAVVLAASLPGLRARFRRPR